MPARLFAKPNLVVELMRTSQPREEKKRIQGRRGRRPEAGTRPQPPTPGPMPVRDNTRSPVEKCAHQQFRAANLGEQPLFSLAFSKSHSLLLGGITSIRPGGS